VERPSLESFIAWVLLFGAIFLIAPFINLFQRTQTGEGIRSGVVVKISYKGRINNSWEGTLMLGSVQSGHTWDFSLDPSDPNAPAIAKELQSVALSRSPVTLQFSQRFIWPWQTDTNYLVQKISYSPQAAN
jgi:hypothetical protein